MTALRGRRAALGMAVIFSLFAALQFNDPDPLRWGVMYGMTAVYSALVGLGRCPSGPVWLWGAILACITVAQFALMPAGPPMGPSWQGPLAYEGVREILGTGLAAAWCGVLGWIARYRVE